MGQEMGALLSVNDISVNYGNIRALKGVSVDVTAGEIVCLIGANGAGKSTLLKAITGLEPITGGSIVFDGTVIAQPDPSAGEPVRAIFGHGASMPTHQVVSLGVAMVPEGRRVFSDLTVQENLDMGAYLQRDDAKIRALTSDVFDRFPILKSRRRQKAGSLSGGEQQMLVIARALMSSPRLLLLDEPGLGLAPLVIRDIFEIITRINRDENVTVFLVEQNARMALSVSRRGYVMETGNVVLVDTSDRLLGNERVRAAYIGD
ncbi:MAG TPA: ABC transporter ATP-binding protein [Spirochaetia bacterium]|nr:ABC transporter ATP-binding protein [Spirochaetia bacterium]